jgi:[ribosomal protein S5]-alanine N-acetyltransferase
MMLRTERLLLRGFSQADWVATLAYHSTPAYQRFYPAVRCTEADAQAFINCFIQWQEERPRSKYQWAIVSPGQD